MAVATPGACQHEFRAEFLDVVAALVPLTEEGAA
jgi:hypothetical protein